MLVVEAGHGALTLLENPDNLLVEPPARIVGLPFEIAVVNPVFSHQDNTIHRQFLPPEREGFPDGGKDRNALRLADFLTQSAFPELMDVNGHNVHPRRRMGALPPI